MVYILGGWQSDFSHNWSREGVEIADAFGECVIKGLAATGLEPKDIECGHVGNFVAELFASQGILGGFFGLVHPDFDGMPTARHEGACASGSLAILAAAAPTVKKTLLELGGKSAHIVLDDTELAAVLPMSAAMACINSGQSCVLPSRILLPRNRYREGVELLAAAMQAFPVGDPWDPANLQGPQISETQRRKVLGMITSGIQDGATLITGGGVPAHLPGGYFVEPTLLADVPPQARVAQEEIFGPVLTVTAYDNEDEAIAIANDSIYGLSGEVSSADVQRATAVAQRLRTGSVTVNGGMFFGLTSPFGGMKQSGLGRRNGAEGFREYLEIKTMGLPV